MGAANLEKYKSKYENYIQIRRKPKDFKIDNDQEVDNPIGLKSKTLTLGAINTYVNKNVISKLVPEGPDQTLLVIDSITGQNAVSQAKEFNNHNSSNIVNQFIMKIIT